MRHGLLAKCVVVSGESHESFEAMLQHHVDRFGPLDSVEFGMVEEMASSYWRLRRAWAIETRLLDDSLRDQPSGDRVGGIAAAFGVLADGPRLALLLRYQASLHRMYQRAIRTLLLLRSDSQWGGPGSPDGSGVGLPSSDSDCETNPVPFPDTPPAASDPVSDPRPSGSGPDLLVPGAV